LKRRGQQRTATEGSSSPTRDKQGEVSEKREKMCVQKDLASVLMLPAIGDFEVERWMPVGTINSKPSGEKLSLLLNTNNKI